MRVLTTARHPPPPAAGSLQPVRAVRVGPALDARHACAHRGALLSLIRYVPFESGQLSTSSDVYEHEIPGGQYTNLLYQSRQLGLSAKWPEIKAMYAKANLLLGDIPKVTPL